MRNDTEMPLRYRYGSHGTCHEIVDGFGAARRRQLLRARRERLGQGRQFRQRAGVGLAEFLPRGRFREGQSRPDKRQRGHKRFCRQPVPRLGEPPRAGRSVRRRHDGFGRVEITRQDLRLALGRQDHDFFSLDGFLAMKHGREKHRFEGAAPFSIHRILYVDDAAGPGFLAGEAQAGEPLVLGQARIQAFRFECGVAEMQDPAFGSYRQRKIDLRLIGVFEIPHVGGGHVLPALLQDQCDMPDGLFHHALGPQVQSLPVQQGDVAGGGIGFAARQGVEAGLQVGVGDLRDRLDVVILPRALELNLEHLRLGVLEQALGAVEPEPAGVHSLQRAGMLFPIAQVEGIGRGNGRHGRGQHKPNRESSASHLVQPSSVTKISLAVNAAMARNPSRYSG